MPLEGQFQRLSPGSQVELFELDLRGIVSSITGEAGAPLYFTPAIGDHPKELLFQGRAYVPMPIKVSGFETSIRGAFPRPRITISNVQGLVSQLFLEYRDLIGAMVTRRRTFVQFLDDGETPDPMAETARDRWYVEQKRSENILQIELELVSALDLQGLKIPSRVIYYNACGFTYEGRQRGVGPGQCSYMHGGRGDQTRMFTVMDEALPPGPESAAQDVCGKRLKSCRLRFGNGVPMDFGAFPGTQRTLR